MFAAIRAFFAVFTTLFAAAETSAQSLLIISTIGKEMAETYQDTSRADREVNAIKNQARLTKAMAKAKSEAALVIENKA